MRRAMLQSIGGCGVSDSDACAFITVTGITDMTLKNAINDLVIGMKSDGSWTQCFAIYPLVGGLESTHKYNLKNPLDTDGAYRLLFSTGTYAWTHNSNGAKPDDELATANTYLSPSAVLNVNSHGLTVAINDTDAYSGTSIGSYNSSTQNLRVVSRNNLSGGNADSSFSGVNTGDGTAEGVITVSKQSSSVHVSFKNGTKISTGTGGGTLPTPNIFLNHQNGNVGPLVYDTKRLCFASIHTGMSDSEITAFYGRIDDFNDALGRKTW